MARGRYSITNDNDTVIGSHNTMSYLEPAHWWMRPFRFIARCQRLTLLQQLDAGVRAVDMRVCFDRKGRMSFAHGAMTFRCSVLLGKLLDRLPQGTVVRLILERSQRPESESAFISLCRFAESAYPGLVFIGGYKKRPWKKLYTFNAERSSDIALHQHVGSMATDARWYERIIPILYHRRNGHAKPLPGINLYDFI